MLAHARLMLCALAVLAIASTTTVRADDAARVVTITHTDLKQAAYRDAHIDGTTYDDAVALEPFEYIAHGNGYRIDKNGWSAERPGRYTFRLDRGTAEEAEIFVYPGGGTGTVNGHRVSFEGIGYGSWFRAIVPGKMLREGRNEIILDGINVGIDLDATPAKRSEISEDGGRTWKPAQGEFYLNIRLKRHPARGVITSPVFDLGSPDDKAEVRPIVALRSLSIDADADTPEGTSIAFEVRRGTRWDYRGAGWGDWHPLDEVDNLVASNAGQLMQWRAVLESKDCTKTPLLRSVTIKAEVEPRFEPDAMRVVSIDQPDIVRSSYDFTWQGPSPKLSLLRERYKLDDIIKPGKTHFEKLVLLRNWVRRQWPHNDMGSGIRTWDALEILGAPDDKHGMCVHYGVTFTQCALALGYNARQVILASHYVSEVWSPEHGKWVLMDVEDTHGEGWSRYGSGHYVDADTGTPLSAIEIHQRLRDDKASSIVQKLSMTNDEGVHETFDRTYEADGLGYMKRFAYPNRNNYLDQLVPWEEFHGFDHYRCSAYLWWKNDATGHTHEYPLQTTRRGDVLWTTNGVRARVYATHTKSGVQVNLEHDMPNLSHFLVGTGDGGWLRLDSNGKPIHAYHFTVPEGGTKALTFKPVNTFGIEGRATTVKLAHGKTSGDN